LPVNAIWKMHVINRGVAKGSSERRDAYRYSDGKYRVADPRLGRGYNRDANSIKVATLEEAAEYVRKGYFIRLTTGEGKANLHSPDRIVIEEI